MARIARAGTLAFCAVLALIAPGCGDGASDDPAVQALLRSANADDGYGARFTLRGSVTEDGATVRLRGYGQIEADEKRDRAVMVVEGERVELITNEPFLFVNADVLPLGLNDKIPAGTRWLKINQDTVADAAGLGGLRGLESLGPTESMEFLSDLDPKVEDVGSERIDGRQTKRYRVRVKLGKLFDALRKRASSVPKVPKSARDEEASFVVWVDRDDLVRRVRLRLEFEQDSFVVTVNVTAYDRGLRVTAPGGAGVYDATKAVAEAARKERQEQSGDDARSS